MDNHHYHLANLNKFNNDTSNTKDNMYDFKWDNAIKDKNYKLIGNIILSNSFNPSDKELDNIYEYRIPINQNNQLENNNFSRILQNFFTPVDIYPTESQIEIATRRVRYSDIIFPINRSCPISLENFTDDELVTVIRFCGHIFNTSELNTWFRSNCRCPVCRYDIRNYNNNNNNNISSENFLNQTNNTSSNQQEVVNENRNSETSEERNTSEINYNNSTIPPNYINNFVDNMLNEFNFNNIDNFVNDISNNNINTSATLFNIFNRLNNTNQRRTL
jgi:hypothetical protein